MTKKRVINVSVETGYFTRVVYSISEYFSMTRVPVREIKLPNSVWKSSLADVLADPPKMPVLEQVEPRNPAEESAASEVKFYYAKA